MKSWPAGSTLPHRELKTLSKLSKPKSRTAESGVSAAGRESANWAPIVELVRILRSCSTFVITSHSSPDGDAIGSSLAMMHLLESMGKTATVALADAVPANFDCLEGVERIRRKLPEERPDAVILLECDRLERSGFTAREFSQMGAGVTINIDHHLSGRAFADFNWIDVKACAVGAMLYELARTASFPISTAMGDCLYTAVLTDTGSFNYPSTNAATFEMAESLVRGGTNPNRIAQAMFFSNPAGKLRLLGTLLSRMRIEGPVCWSTITRADLQEAGASDDDTEGAVNYLISIAGVQAAALLRETVRPGEYRVSLRGKGTVDVSIPAARFGGGGHLNAAGCTLQGSRAEVTERVLEGLREACGVDMAARQPGPAEHPVSTTLLA